MANAGKDGGGQDSITKYPAGSSGDAAPVAEIKGANTKLFSPSGLTVDSNGNIYVANPGSILYAAHQSPKVLAVDTITVYSPGSTGNIAPREDYFGQSHQAVVAERNRSRFRAGASMRAASALKVPRAAAS